MLKQTEFVNENTLLAQLTISVKLYEDDYVDNSAHIKFQTLFGSKLPDELNLKNGGGLSQIKLTQERTIVDDAYQETISSR